MTKNFKTNCKLKDEEITIDKTIIKKPEEKILIEDSESDDESRRTTTTDLA